MAIKVEPPASLLVKLTRAESMAMNVALEAGMYPKQAGFPVEAVRRALVDLYPYPLSAGRGFVFCPQVTSLKSRK